MVNINNKTIIKIYSLRLLFTLLIGTPIDENSWILKLISGSNIITIMILYFVINCVDLGYNLQMTTYMESLYQINSCTNSWFFVSLIIRYVITII